MAAQDSAGRHACGRASDGRSGRVAGQVGRLYDDGMRDIRTSQRWIGPALLSVALAACSTTRYRPVSDFPVKIGAPYKVRGVTYTPAEDPTFDVLGYASWYGSESGN